MSSFLLYTSYFFKKNTYKQERIYVRSQPKNEAQPPSCLVTSWIFPTIAWLPRKLKNRPATGPQLARNWPATGPQLIHTYSSGAGSKRKCHWRPEHIYQLFTGPITSESWIRISAGELFSAGCRTFYYAAKSIIHYSTTLNFGVFPLVEIDHVTR